VGSNFNSCRTGFGAGVRHFPPSIASRWRRLKSPSVAVAISRSRIATTTGTIHRGDQGTATWQRSVATTPTTDPEWSADALRNCSTPVALGHISTKSCMAGCCCTIMPEQPHPVRILAALERRPSTWTRTGPHSIEHDGLRVRLIRGATLVHIEHIIPDRVPVRIKTAPATLARITDLLEDWLRKDQPDDTWWGSGDSP
jgi:hypothetical protein